MQLSRLPQVVKRFDWRHATIHVVIVGAAFLIALLFVLVRRV